MKYCLRIYKVSARKHDAFGQFLMLHCYRNLLLSLAASGKYEFHANATSIYYEHLLAPWHLAHDNHEQLDRQSIQLCLHTFVSVYRDQKFLVGRTQPPVISDAILTRYVENTHWYLRNQQDNIDLFHGLCLALTQVTGKCFYPHSMPSVLFKSYFSERTEWRGIFGLDSFLKCICVAFLDKQEMDKVTKNVYRGKPRVRSRTCCRTLKAYEHPRQILVLKVTNYCAYLWSEHRCMDIESK